MIRRLFYMDIITNNYFNKFVKEHAITGKNVETNFEKFINYICLSSKNISNFNLMATCVGSGNDAGIDGIAISINNRFVSDMTELKTILDMGMDFTVEFFFVQAKTTEAFECKEISTFGDGVADMFRGEEETKKIMNEIVSSKYKMIREILNNYEYVKQKKCFLYYITPGSYVEDDNLLAAKAGVNDRILGLGIFEDTDIEINIEDRAFIRKQYERTKVQNSATFELNSKIDIPYMDKVDEAYFAIMPIKEYLKIVLDENDRIRRGIFELNVRDFAGIENNRVNQDIVSTLHSNDSTKFGLLNNGITIVGKSLSKGQGKYTIKNFYIVNGCQTTNVLSENIEKINDDMWLSVKIVITQDDRIIRDIVKATNNQTEVEEIQLLSMDEYQEELESFYNSFTKYTRLYYERRDGQYRGNPEAELIKIVNPETQMKSFASIFLNVPQIASRFAGKLQEEISKKIFIKEHRNIMYYTAGLIHYRLEKAFINDEIDGNYNKFKYHIETIISHVVWKNDKKPQANSYKMDEYCEKLILAIEDHGNFIQLLGYAKKCIDAVVRNIGDTEANKTASIVNQLLLYSEIELNGIEINQAIYFNNMFDNYLLPFKNMKIDGDMRYNFCKNFSYLKSLIDDNHVASKLINNDILIEVENNINEDSRDSRKSNSIKVCNELSRVNKLIDEKIKIVNVYKNRQ
jgi:hypothetical protein